MPRKTRIRKEILTLKRELKKLQRNEGLQKETEIVQSHPLREPAFSSQQSQLPTPQVISDLRKSLVLTASIFILLFIYWWFSVKLV